MRTIQNSMKKILVFIPLFFFGIVHAQVSANAYEIHVTLKPFKNQFIYLGHYSGKQLPIIDSVKLNDKSEGVFKGKIKLGGGIYLIGYPDKSGIIEILVDKQQNFSVIADTATLRTKGAQFINSPDNELFNAYQQEMKVQGKKIDSLKQLMSKTTNAKDSANMSEELTKLDKTVLQYREDLIQKNSNTILATYLIAMREPVLSAALKNSHTKDDSVAAYHYIKDHFWDGVNFWDGRLARTPASLFESKLDKYFEQLVAYNPDSVIHEMDWMLGYASADSEMNKFLLLKFVNRYLNQKYMWEDKVFLHLFEKYFSNKTYSWLTEKGVKTISDRAYNLMANILGNPAADIELPDTSGKKITLYNLPGNYFLVCFWDPVCGHCKEVLPEIDSIYRKKWKQYGLKVFAIAKETEGSKSDWMNFIHERSLGDWTNVYYAKAEEKSRVDAGIPGYSQLYDIQTFPTLYLLDKDKNIIAKKLSWQQMDEILDRKIKNQ